MAGPTHSRAKIFFLLLLLPSYALSVSDLEHMCACERVLAHVVERERENARTWACSSFFIIARGMEVGAQLYSPFPGLMCA